MKILGKARIDLTGRQFGALTVVGFAGSRKSSPASKSVRYWECVCVCGNTTTVSLTGLTSGNTQSCGCRRGNRKHLDSYTSEYSTWNEMRSRCRSPKHRAYSMYGGRGIFVCDRWNDSFKSFLDDMGRRPSPKHSLDRIDNDGPYSPENCRWATQKLQCSNRRNTRRYTLNGESLSLHEWSDRTGLPYTTLDHRYRNGWPAELALTQPLRRVL